MGGRPPKPASSTAQPATVPRHTTKANGTRATGWRDTKIPTTGKVAMAATAEKSSTPLDADRDMPWATR